MPRSKKEKLRLKKLTEARLKIMKERGAADGPGTRLSAALPDTPQLVASTSSRSPPPPPPPLPQQASSTPTSSRSSFKLEHVPEIEVTETPQRRYRVIDMDNLLQWARSFARCQCGGKMHVQEDDRHKGNVTYLVSTCSACDKEYRMCTSTGGVTRATAEQETCPYDVHTRLVKATLNSSSGYIGLRELGKSLNTSMLSATRYDILAKKTYEDTIEKLEAMMGKTRSALHEMLEEEGDKNDVKKIRVSCDGSWSKRGFTSMYGFVSVIEVTTGWAIDFVVLSKYCKVCSMSGRGVTPPDHECTKNFDGSSPAMEMEGWKLLWQRSINKCKFRYEEVVSDGDSKGIAAVQKLQIYEVTKFECTNHVAKRIGTALRSVKTAKKLGGKKEGSLTLAKITRLSNYFGKAIKQETSVEDMKNSIYATLKHCTSTDATPHHSQCPDGRRSWCFYKRAIATNQKIPKHTDKMKTYLRPTVVSQILPIYQRVVTPELLEKCKGETQNSNECLHSVIWNELPKTKFFSLNRMKYSIYRCVVQFNHGSAALSKALGDSSLMSSIRTDTKRKRGSIRAEEKKKEIKEKKIKKIQEEEDKKEAEGETYGAGIAPV